MGARVSRIGTPAQGRGLRVTGQLYSCTGLDRFSPIEVPCAVPKGGLGEPVQTCTAVRGLATWAVPRSLRSNLERQGGPVESLAGEPVLTDGSAGSRRVVYSVDVRIPALCSQGGNDPARPSMTPPMGGWRVAPSPAAPFSSERDHRPAARGSERVRGEALASSVAMKPGG